MRELEQDKETPNVETEREEGSTLEELYDQGYRRVCIGCKTAFKPGRVRKEFLSDGHGERSIEMCKCGSDLIGYIVEEEGSLYICREPQVDENSIFIQTHSS